MPSGSFGAGADRSALPSFVRGMPGIGGFGHCAEATAAIADSIVIIGGSTEDRTNQMFFHNPNAAFILRASGRADKMPHVAVVFLADVLHQFVARQQAM